ERIIDADRRHRQLTSLADGYKPKSKPGGEHGPEDEPARLEPGDGAGAAFARRVGEMVERCRKPFAVGDKGGDVAEQDARRRKIRHRAHERLDLVGSHERGAPPKGRRRISLRAWA